MTSIFSCTRKKLTHLSPSIFTNSLSICVRHASVITSTCPSGIMILLHRLINISGAPLANRRLLPFCWSCHRTLMDLRSRLNSKTALFSMPGNGERSSGPLFAVGIGNSNAGIRNPYTIQWSKWGYALTSHIHSTLSNYNNCLIIVCQKNFGMGGSPSIQTCWQLQLLRWPFIQ